VSGRGDGIDVGALVEACASVGESEDDGWPFEGGCAAFAVAVNRFVGGGDADRVFVGSYSRETEKKYGARMFSHVAVALGDVLLDASGLTNKDDLLALAGDERTARVARVTGAEAMDGTDVTEDPSGREREVERLVGVLRSAYAAATGRRRSPPQARTRRGDEGELRRRPAPRRR
jgi:hypothetical protein